MSEYGDQSVRETSWTSVFVGIACAMAVVGMLYLCVAAYPNAAFDTFRFVALFSGLISFVVFSNQRHFAIGQVYGGFHQMAVIVRLWAGIFLAVIVLTYLAKSGAQFSRVVMISWALLTPFGLLCVSILCRLLIYRLYTSKDNQRRAVFVGLGTDARMLAMSIQQAKAMGVVCEGYFDDAPDASDTGSIRYLGNMTDVTSWVKAHQVDVVFVELNAAHKEVIAGIVESLQDSVTSLYFIPESNLFGMGQLRQSQVAGFPVLVAYETPFIGLAQLVKRLCDVIFSALILLLLLPLLVAIALGIKISSPGPILFRQKRYGMGGMEIDVWKFRSMVIHNEHGQVSQATTDDRRITRFGRFLRKTSLDELPQFFNVLQGHMSIVGPRPHAIQHNEQYRRQIRGYMMRHKVKPGITGWAQVNGYRGETDTLDKMQKRLDYDLYYIRHWSLKQDFVIILRTIALVFFDKHAY